MVLCAGCAQASLERIRGTEENLACDRCHQVEGGGNANVAQLDIGGVLIVVMWAFCNACAAAVAKEQEPPTPSRTW
jgi:hypothetical protein